EKLDQKQCECLEEVLRRVQFKILDLEASHLDDECAVALFDMIEYYESACQLNISFNKNIQARGWQACSRLVRRTPNLTYLDVRSCDLNDRNIPIFGRALKLGCHLTILHMESMNLSGRPLVILVAALKMNEVLQELFLADNKLMPTDGVQLGNLLRYNRKLSLLDLRNNHLQDVGTSHISDGLVEQGKGPGLRTLVLWNNAVNYQAMPALGRALAANETLETLNIGHNTLTNEGVHLLKDGLLKTNSLLRLGLQGTRITDEGAVALAEYIADSTILLRIDLRDNDIKTGGLMALSHAMRVNTSITRIDLDKEPKKESSMKDYAEQQSLLLRDIYTFQQRNIEAAVQREEQERASVKQKLDTFLAAGQEEAADEQTVEGLPSDSSTADSVALLEVESEVCETDVEQEKDRKDAENIKTKSIEEQLKESPNQNEQLDSDEVDSSIAKEEIKNRQRPSILFPYLGLPPQASLDSPLPTSSVSPLISGLSESVSGPPPLQPLRTTQKDFLTLNVGTAPGEMILSPQYFPKQIARKIFSVSRVTEDSSLSRLSTSPTPSHPLAATFDPLNVSPVPLIPASSARSSSLSPLPPSSPVLVPRSAARAFQQSKAETRVSVSPSSMLFQKLAEETVRHMISPIVDRAAKEVLSENTEKLESKDITTAVGAESNAVPAFSNTFNTSALNQEMLFTSPSASLDTTGLCDSQISLFVGTGNIFSSVGNSTLPTSLEDLAVMNNITKDAPLTDFTLEEELLQQKRLFIPENTLNKTPWNSLETFNSSSNTETDVSDILTGIGVCRRDEESECKVESPEYVNFSDEENSSSAGNVSHLESDNITLYVDAGAGDAKQTKDISEREDFAAQFTQQHTADIDSDNSLLSLVDTFDRETSSAPKVTDKLVMDELMPVCLNNSSSPALLLPEDTLEVSPDRCESYGNEEPNLSSFEDLGSLDIGASGHQENVQVNSSDISVKSASADVSSDHVGSHADVHNSNRDSTETVDFSLDEESWLAIGAETENSATDKSKQSTTPPDFFTTLSLNGLTQELASALTLLDGATSSYENEDDSAGDLRPHDEFERELDAMLALVQSDLPWPLKES
ncbi:unnamed protein product, partial [Candidula unifasciata]